jgi:hypothetical protein
MSNENTTASEMQHPELDIVDRLLTKPPLHILTNMDLVQAADEIDILRVWCEGVEADNTTYRNLYNATLQQRDEARRELCRRQKRSVVFDHALAEAERRGWNCFEEEDCRIGAENLQAEIERLTAERDDAKDKPLALTPQPICTAPRDGTPILVWDGEWNAWVAARWLIVCGINKGLDSGGWYGDHDCSWRANCLDVRTPQWWLPMPPDPTKILNGIVVGC